MPKKKEILKNSFKKKPTSKEFRVFFLLQFTKELIKNSAPSEVFELKNILEEEKEVRKKLPLSIKEKIREREKPLPVSKEEELTKPLTEPFVKRTFHPLQERVLRIPKPKLPPGLEYLKPTATNVEIDLGKLNPLIKDPLVKAIECIGPDENIIVKGGMGIKKTNIILSRQEIDQIIKKFSEISRIPLHEGIFKVVAGKLILSAIISEVIGSRFMIQKIMYSPFLKR